ncbi:uncharacterized protein LOC125370964 [Ricinus communis]|uniref:uncharacterized protein LOC125370964 n=1 Tax=Ricinus communis TaxID=3988 RepID=UPI00201AD84E|nr:uncharacterized protein LOC125370964 [Ricinus communis]
MVSPDWELPFELMCDASDFAVGAVLGQRREKKFQPIYYASKTLTDAQEHYTTTEKELLAVVFAFDKFRSYLVLSKTIVYTDHSTLRIYADQIIRRCVYGEEVIQILKHCHEGPVGGHQAVKHTARKVLDAGFYWSTIFQHMSRFVMHANGQPEAQALPTNDARVVVKFLKKLFSRFGTPRALISDRGTHFSYHPQTSGQVEVTNRGFKRILEKTVGASRKDWATKLDDALWAFRTAYRTSTGFTPFRLVYGKGCHLLVEAKTKQWHDKRLKGLKEFNVGDSVLLFNSRLRLFPRKLKSRWSGPFTVTQVFPYGAVELHHPEKGNFKVSGQRLKHYLGGSLDMEEHVNLALHF